MSEAATMEDVARAAGCSINTVSRALNDKPDISSQTRARVLATVERLGYVRHAPARALAAGRTRTIGLVMLSPAKPIYASIIQSVEQVARRQGYTVLLADTGEDPEQEARAVRLFREHMVDGVLLTPSLNGGDAVRYLRKGGIAVVVVVRPLRDGHGADVDVVGVDNAGSVYQGTRHLLALGRRRISYIGMHADHATGRPRLEGYRRAMAEADQACDEWLATPDGSGGGDLVATYELTKRWAVGAARAGGNSGAGERGLVVGRSRFVPPVYRALRETRLRVPEDVAVLGIGEFPLAPYLEVPLTHMSHPISAIGTRAAELLLRRIEEQRSGAATAPERVLLPGELIVLDSCGGRRGAG